MSRVDYKKDYSYADTRLRGTTLLTKEREPIYIHSVGYKGEVICTKLLKGPNETVVKLEEIDCNTPRLGYINNNKSSTYCTRMPTRHYKQGLNKNNVFFRGQFVNPTSKPFALMLTNHYPTAYEANKLGENMGCCFGFTYDFAAGVSKDSKERNVLFFRGNRVGNVNINNDNGFVKAILNDRYKFLEEMMKEQMDAE